jgi:tRNA1(Val) A37 N6-methylase TrmN6
MKRGGNCFLVLPYEEGKIFTEMATQNNLYLQKQQLIFPFRGSIPNRMNMQFGFEKPTETGTDMFIIREDDGHFSKQYKLFLKDYLIGLF